MKRKISIFALLLTMASTTHAQMVSDGLSWVTSTTPLTTATSPDFDFCNGTSVNYRIDGAEGFQHNTSAVGGIIIPGNLATNNATTVPLSFTFNQEVCNLRIRIVDLDAGIGTGVGTESINSVSPAYDGLAGSLSDPGGSTSINATVDDAEGWIEWNGPVTSVSFNYIRGGRGFGLIIDSVTFDCCLKPCECKHKATFKNFGTITNPGETTPEISLSSNGLAVRSISIDLFTYFSLVEPEACKKCDLQNQDRFGTIRGGDPIAGAPAELKDPLALGYSRTVTWTFPTPTVVNHTVRLDLLFPPVEDLSCCVNNVRYCLDVTFQNEDCSSCEYTICNTQDGNKSAKTEQHEDSGFYDGPSKTEGFLLIPNPTDGKVAIELQDESFIGGKITVRSTSGAVLSTAKMNGTREALDISGLSSGSYLISIEREGKTTTQTLIIR